ncbi:MULTISPECIES: cupredoxin domain-containing protein [Oligella]|nr:MULTISPECIES: cupredoxin domain-containing protein [Oligella]AVL70464.1 cupredoxin domain-containing protein [Oligella urethralis]MDK6203550.1 cupredoxin domain-containing protein [Oligella urethralis]OFS88277.1 hypothetical protein HMPREF3144_02475 [Oligella sp. HMSC05A10]OFV47652.1 hypothetical protein HMPREF3179_08060 [Oligella sp. HMSC09E12]PMC16668.1 cupredoxin domain-containing protein [Oligella urethralis]
MALITSFFLSASPVMAKGKEKHTVQLQMKDGDLIPMVLEAPANTIIRIEVTNIGTGPAEFESLQLRKEKVLAPGVTSVVVIAPKKPGEYDFFDDFHLDKPKGKLIVK